MSEGPKRLRKLLLQIHPYRVHIATVLAVLAAFLIVWFSESFQSCVKANDYQDSHQALKNGLSYAFRIWWWCGGIFAHDNAEAITAVATVVLTGSTVGLWVVTKESADAAKLAAEALPTLERAYLFIKRTSDRSLSSIAKGGRYSGVALQHIANVGRTPAIIKVAYCTVAICARPEQIVFTNKLERDWIIPPNCSDDPEEGDYSRALHATLREVDIADRNSMESYPTEEELLGIKNGTSFVWLCNHIVYEDVFGRSHATASIHRVNPETFRLEEYGGKEWNYRT